MEDPKDFDENTSPKNKTPLWIKIVGGIIIGLVAVGITYGLMLVMLPS
jgi:hypothetical protein